MRQGGITRADTHGHGNDDWPEKQAAISDTTSKDDELRYQIMNITGGKYTQEQEDAMIAIIKQYGTQERIDEEKRDYDFIAYNAAKDGGKWIELRESKDKRIAELTALKGKENA